MSADNWAVCPTCLNRHEKRLAELRVAAAAAYGEVPIAEFDRLRAEVEDLEERELDPSFREDYEIFGAEEGEVQVRYSGNCRECGTNLKFESAHPIKATR